MKSEKIYPSSVDQRGIDCAVQVLSSGGVVLYPTDTLYALGCDALNSRAVERLCAAKGINPAKQLLSVVCSDIAQAAGYARIDNRAFAILKHYLPGPYTFVLPASARLPKVFKGRRTVGIRICDNPITTALAAAMGNPVLSASVSVDADCPEEAAMPGSLAVRYDSVADLMIDGGEGATEGSTVVDLTDSSSPVIIRPGRGTFE